MTAGSRIVLLCLVLLVPSALDSGEDTPERLFDRAVELAAEGRYQEAVDKMERLLGYDPDHPDVIWNLGLWYAELGRHKKALQAWKRYREVDPGQWRARAKLIQVYQALGRLEFRDEERDGLLEWYAGLSEPRRLEQDLFCREQFRVGEQKVMAFEYFHPSGERMLFLRFSVLDASGREAEWYSLGSYEVTNQIARATGEIGEDENLYHLDRYDASSHSTFAFFKRMPTYETVRQHVVAALEGELEPVSSMIRDR